MQSYTNDGILHVYFWGTAFTFFAWLLNFIAIPYKEMENKWFAHFGFFYIWKKRKKEFAALITSEIKEVRIHGLSQGGGVAILAHEFVWFNFPRLREKLFTFTYGAPRCIFLIGYNKIKDRFSNVKRIINPGDIVDNLPPFFFGFKHVGTEEKTSLPWQNFIKAHASYNIRWRE